MIKPKHSTEPGTGHFFSSPGQVALVIDPVEGKLAWFSLDQNAIAKFGEASTQRGSRSRGTFADSGGDPRGGVPLRRVVAITSVAVVVTAALAWGVGLAVRPPDATGALQQRNADYQELVSELVASQARFQEAQDRFQDIASNPVILYTVREGDTIESIALRFYESPEAVEFLREVNGLSPDDELRPGAMLRLLDIQGAVVEDALRQDFPTPRWEAPTPEPTTPPGSDEEGVEEPEPTPSLSRSPSETTGP
jgi:hypothetical protein